MGVVYTVLQLEVTWQTNFVIHVETVWCRPSSGEMENPCDNV